MNAAAVSPIAAAILPAASNSENTCPACKGTGKGKFGRGRKAVACDCQTCGGAGKVEWVETINGRRHPRRIESVRAADAAQADAIFARIARGE